MHEAELTARLVAAQRDSSPSVDPTPYIDLSRDSAHEIQDGVNAALDRPVGMLKTAVHPDGVGVVAPIPAQQVGRAPRFHLSARGVAGLEVEVGVVLARDVPMVAGLDEATVRAAIDDFFLGVEVCGSRYSDRTRAGLMGSLADNMSSYGYVIGPRRALGDAIEGLEVRLVFGGAEIYAAPVQHGFGTVLASIVAYARAQRAAYPLRAGTIITTGSLCGLVPTSGGGHVEAHLGSDSLAFELDGEPA
jgi:2-keto-4-pentenoate hydratase